MITPTQAVDRYGSAAKLAAILRVPDSTVRSWLQGGRLPDSVQLILALRIDPEHWKDTAAQFELIYPRYAGPTDERLRFVGRRRGPRSVLAIRA